jgi:hypothetical protein
VSLFIVYIFLRVSKSSGHHDHEHKNEVEEEIIEEIDLHNPQPANSEHDAAAAGTSSPTKSSGYQEKKHNDMEDKIIEETEVHNSRPTKSGTKKHKVEEGTTLHSTGEEKRTKFWINGILAERLRNHFSKSAEKKAKDEPAGKGKQHDGETEGIGKQHDGETETG